MQALSGVVKNYAWGKVGDDSLVATLHSENEVAKDSQVDQKQRYAELWMGTHVSGPSMVVAADKTETTLSEYLNGRQLPYLFKVLAVDKCLSIQAHPDKTLARELFARDPTHYKDDNHKPEIAIALTPFQAMCGFRVFTEISSFFRTVPELRMVVGAKTAAHYENVVDDSKSSLVAKTAALKAVFGNLMKIDNKTLTKALTMLHSRLSIFMSDSVAFTSSNHTVTILSAEMICWRLFTQYPGDVGIFAPFFLNCIELAPGQSIFLPANEPHAYLQGNCIEAMARSDNVVRAGCTPKFRDVDTLIDMLSYKTFTASSVLVQQQPVSEGLYRYVAPVEEFQVLRVELDTNKETKIPPLPSEAILITIAGQGQANDGNTARAFAKGTVLLLPINQAVTISSGSKTKAFICFAPGPSN